MIQAFSQSYTYDILIKGGTVIDPKNKIHARRDVAIKDGRIAAVEPSLAGKTAKQVVDAKGLIVTP
jgi:dihydroorotase